jgi:cbb3-type cytochrome oxidase subunit 3
LVGVDSKTLVSFLLFYFILFSFCFVFFFYQKSNSQVFGTKLRFN